MHHGTARRLTRVCAVCALVSALWAGPPWQAAGPSPAARSPVVINEIFYNAPEDLDDLQFIELHNPGAAAVEVGGWKFSRGVQLTFPAGAKIEPNGYLVLAKDLKLFKRHYGFDAAYKFDGTLSRSGERLELVDPQGTRIDGVEYKSRAPWPVAPDGHGSSLERICPTAAGDSPDNWAPSPLPVGVPKPAGTPGKRNAAFAPRPLPTVSNVVIAPEHAAPDTPIKVEADVRSADEVRDVELRYRVATSGSETTEQSMRMTKTPAGRYAASIPGQKAGRIVRIRIRAVDAKGGERVFPSPHELRPALSCYVHEKLEPGNFPSGLIIHVDAGEQRAAQHESGGGFAPPRPPVPARGNSAFVYVSPKARPAGTPELFDFIQVTPRKGGRKVRFHKDRPLDGMTTINLIYEGSDRFILAEPLAYELYRRAGNAACRTDFVRTWIDGRPIGFQLLIEQPNKAFLRHNGLHSDGNLYKLIWFGQGVVGQHEKKTHIHAGHDDVVKLVAELNRTKGDAQWEVIKKNFEVEQVINYFAVNMLLSHWDGYFNNYFTYHDVKGTGKWTMYPWDQDKTWGFHDGIGGYEVFYDMPITFGMNGDVPPGWPKGRPAPQGFGFGSVWWRGPGHFSGPLLANPRFRKLFLARTKELLEKVYTEEVFFPLIKQLGERLEPEFTYRASLHREDPKPALEHLQRNLDSLREHLVKRRKFLLDQQEIKTAGAFERSELK